MSPLCSAPLLESPLLTAKHGFRFRQGKHVTENHLHIHKPMRSSALHFGDTIHYESSHTCMRQDSDWRGSVSVTLSSVLNDLLSVMLCVLCKVRAALLHEYEAFLDVMLTANIE